MESCSVGSCFARRHGGVRSFTVYRRRRSCAAIQGGDTLRGNKRALDISRHHCISRNLLGFFFFFLLRVDKMTGRMRLGSAQLHHRDQTERDVRETCEWSGEVRIASRQCRACFAVHFDMQMQGRWRKRGEDRGGGGEGARVGGEEELEGFDAMQTGCTKARRQKFSVHHTNKSAPVPALAQYQGQLVAKSGNQHQLL